MNEKVEKIVTPIKDFWAKLSKKVKILLVSGVSAVLIVGLLFLVILNTKQYTTLFTGLSQEESVEVIKVLQEKGADYKFENSGSSILVDKKQESLLRMELATAGYPRDTLSAYSTYGDNVDFMTTDADRRLYETYQSQERAQSSIETISGVKNAIVTFVLPEEDGYVWEESKGKSSASVTLEMIDGYGLLPEQVNGIKRLVATSIPDLLMENIAVIDALTGEELSTNNELKYVDMARFKLDIEKELQKDIESNIKRLLDKVYGKDNFEVAAKTYMNLDDKIKEVIEYTPSTEDEKGMLETEIVNQEKVVGEEEAGGVVGAETNAELPNYVGLTDDGNAIYYKNDIQYNYLVNKMTELITSKTPEISETTIAVTINRKMRDLTDTEKEDLIQSVANAAGISPTKVSVFNAEFGGLDVLDEPTNTGLFDNKILVISISAAALLLLIGLIVVILVNKKIKKKKQQEEEALALAAAGETGIKIEGEAMPNLLDDLKNVPETKEQALKKEIQDFSQTNPEIVAQLLRTWLKGDEE